MKEETTGILESGMIRGWESEGVKEDIEKDGNENRGGWRGRSVEIMGLDKRAGVERGWVKKGRQDKGEGSGEGGRHRDVAAEP